MTLTEGGYTRPCPIPGHPQDDPDDGAALASGSAWQRIRAWHLHAPAERLPLPLILTAWPAAWIMHAARVPGHILAYAAAAAAVACWLTWRRHERSSPQPRLAATEAALVAAAAGVWIAAAVTWGPLGWPAHLLTWIYIAGSAGGYIWLRRHEAVRAARKRRDDLAADLADKALWHHILSRTGLGGWHVQWRRPTNLGEERLITTSPENALASRIAGNSSGIAEKLAHILGLPYGRIDVTTTDYPGELIISIRTVDVSTRSAAYHPMTTPWPDKEPSPFTAWFPAVATIRDPVPWGFSPEDGSPLAVELFSSIGGRAVGVIGMTGSGKSNLLNNVREGITRCPDARLVQLNGAHMGDETVWEPLSALTLCGPVATDEEIRDKIAAALAALCQLVTKRSATLAQTGHSTFQPDAEHPAIGIVIDEVDEIVAHVPGAGKALEFLASKQRKSAVFLLLATQRATIAALGGGMVRANMSEVLVGKVARASESRHATGAEKEIPDIRDYAKGEPGYFQRWDPHSGTVTGRGRAFLLGKPPEELAYMKRIVATRRGLRDWPIPDMPPLVLDDDQAAGAAVTSAQAQDIAAMRGRLASISPAPQPAEPAVPPVPGGVRALPVVPGVPPKVMAVLYPLLASGRTSAAAVGLRLGVSKTTAYEYLAAMRKYGFAEVAGGGRASGWQLPERPEVPQDKRELAGQYIAASQYATLEDLAQAVHDGLVDADDDTRGVLEEVRRITGRKRLSIVPHDDGE